MFTIPRMKLVATFFSFVLIIFIGNVSALTSSTVIFTGTEPGFSDISLNNFVIEGNKNETNWTFKFTGRAGTKLSIHFFTKLEGNVEVMVYDGPTNGSPLIDISSILNNPIFSNGAFRAPLISSKANSMYIEIRSLPNDQNINQDFQAIVTDHDNTAAGSCSESMVVAVTQGSGNTQSNKYNLTMNGNNCINILRAVDITNSPTITGFVQFISGTDTMKVYKGLKISDETELLRNPFMATDRNIIVRRTAPANMIYYWGHLKSSVSIRSLDKQTLGSIMTRDYITFLPPHLQQSFTQNFLFQPLISAPYPAGSIFTLEFSILKNIGSSKLVISTSDAAGNLVKTINVTDSGVLPQKVSVTGPIIMVAYSNTELPYTTGLYATYQLKSVQTPVNPVITTPKPDKASNIVCPTTMLIIMLFKLIII